jgi:hypothetical protein
MPTNTITKGLGAQAAKPTFTFSTTGSEMPTYTITKGLGAQAAKPTFTFSTTVSDLPTNTNTKELGEQAAKPTFTFSNTRSDAAVTQPDFPQYQEDPVNSREGGSQEGLLQSRHYPYKRDSRNPCERLKKANQFHEHNIAKPRNYTTRPVTRFSRLRRQQIYRPRSRSKRAKRRRKRRRSTKHLSHPRKWSEYHAKALLAAAKESPRRARKIPDSDKDEIV